MFELKLYRKNKDGFCFNRCYFVESKKISIWGNHGYKINDHENLIDYTIHRDKFDNIELALTKEIVFNFKHVI